ncbi:unnamed protein product [Phyllotreta striolata]|uniref:Elongation of very long chain fatty acids protein n=1 Tax=Phyllotreta striolata TaxID=444603 RepID=A0A9N9TWJ6_PHYSR|nr:unnamed protein product [Phyllotreta striolata]
MDYLWEEAEIIINLTKNNSTDVTDIVKIVADRCQNVIEKTSDPRTADWPFMQSIFPTVTMVLGYLYVVIFLGPNLMENRKPFKLKEVLLAYNSAQVLYSLFMLYEHLMSGWFWDYSFRCQPVDYSTNSKALRMANLCWWYYISKLTEFADTIFFVMRKKNSQVTFLHVYHHSLTPIETWFLVKFFPGGHGTFSNLINNLVHVIMYLYYMLSGLGPEYQKYVWWKKHLTTLQLVQFGLVFGHSAQLIWYDCGYPKWVGYFLLIHSTIFFALFSNFYYQRYENASKTPKTVKKD